MTFEDFMKNVRKSNEWHKHSERWTEAERLRESIMSGEKSDEEWVLLRKEVKEFFETDAPEEDKEMLRGYTETLAMMCTTIKER